MKAQAIVNGRIYHFEVPLGPREEFNLAPPLTWEDENVKLTLVGVSEKVAYYKEAK